MRLGMEAGKDQGPTCMAVEHIIYPQDNGDH